MAILKWDETGDRLYELGVDHGVVYPWDDDADDYGDGEAWNGLTSVSISSDGGEPNDLYADNIQYATIMSNEKITASVEAYQAPAAFDAADGAVSPVVGLKLRQQKRKMFGFVFRSRIGNDTDDVDHGYKIHILYGCHASPTERSYETINDSPDAGTLSWDLSTLPVDVAGYKPCAYLEIDSTKANATKLEALESTLFGSANASATLPGPADIITALTPPSGGGGGGQTGS